MKMGVLHNTYTIAKAHQMVVKPILFFDLLATENILPDPEAWRRVMSVLPAGQPFDEAMPKPLSEVLLIGNAVSQDDKSVTELEVELRVGALQKKLKVTGDRIWQKRFLRRKASPPAAFTSKPITWDRAFGFNGLAENPVGQGALTQGAAGETLIALPNIEYLDDQQSSPRGKIMPAGYGPINSLWAPRTQSNALFDQAYIDRIFPALPDDLDFSRFNMAPIDQRMELVGTEPFSLLNLHAEQAKVEGTLPGFTPRAFVDIDGSLAEVDLHLETVWFLPSVGMGALVFCGQKEVGRRHAQLEVDNLLLAYESADSTPRTIEYYESVLRKRTDPKTSIAHVMDESQLSPQPSSEQQALQQQQHNAELARVNLARTNAAKTQQDHITAKHGLTDVAYTAPQPIDPRLVKSPESIAQRDFSLAPMLEYVAEQRSKAEKQLIDAKSDAAENPDQQVMSADSVREKALEQTTEQNSLSDKLPPLSATDTTKRLNPEEQKKLELSGRAAALNPQPISYLKAQDAGAVLRAAVTEMRKAGESLAYRDFTGADLSGFDLSNENLAGSIFECACLEDCSLVGANLSGASFIGAKVSRCDFSNADLANANFSHAVGEDVLFVNADLSGRVMMHSTRLETADFTGAKLIGVLMVKAQLRCALFQGALLTQTTSTASDFSGTEFIGSSLEGCLFTDCRLRYSAWQEVVAKRCVILNCSLQFASFFECSLERCQWAGSSWLTGVSFIKSRLQACGFRSAEGTGIAFDESAICESDLAMVNFPWASFKKTTFAGCLANESNYAFSDFTNALLAKTNFQDSKFTGSDLTGTDFFQSDVLLAEFDGANYDDAVNIMPNKILRLNNDRR
jgi:uncharacterized protein YjbI with pentapeptide repeats